MMICGTDRCFSMFSSALSTPNSGYTHSKMGNPSATDGGGSAGGGAVGRRCNKWCGCSSGMGEPMCEVGAGSVRCSSGT